ncbi:MAG TPA: hypothetical protein PLS94_15515, partial [Prolixibacteraceae bacterium]|nr:hypothetical protein [Prolixibacteraceae bacterium]
TGAVHRKFLMDWWNGGMVGKWAIGVNYNRFLIPLRYIRNDTLLKHGHCQVRSTEIFVAH